MANDEVKIDIIVNYGEKNAETIRASIEELRQRLEQLGKINVEYHLKTPKKPEINALFDALKGSANKGIKDLINSIGDENIWKKALDRLSEFRGGLKVKPAEYLYKQSAEFKDLFASSFEDLSNIVSAMTKKTEAELSNMARMFKATKKDIKKAVVDPEVEEKLEQSLTNFSEKAVKMTFALQERVRQIYTAFLRENISQLSNLSVDLTTPAKEIVKTYPDIFNNVVDTILRQMAVGGKDLTEVFEGLFKADYTNVNVLDFYNRLAEALQDLSQLQRKYNGDLEKAYDQWQQSTNYARGYRSELLQMGIQMWFLSIAMRQFMNSIRLMIEGDDILTTQLDLLSNTLSNLTYGWFAWSRMIEMTWRSMINFNTLTETMQKSLSRHIGIMSNWIALVIGLVISLIPYITQYQNKIREGFQKTAKDINSFSDTLKELLNPKNLETYLYNLEETFKKYGKIFKKAGLSTEDIFEGLKTEASFKIILKPILDDKLIETFFKTPEGKRYIQQAKKTMSGETIPVEIAIDPVATTEYLAKRSQQIYKKAKQIFLEEMNKTVFTEEDLKRQIEIEQTRWKNVEDYFKSTIVPTLTFKEQLATMDEKEIEILKLKAEVENDYNTQHLIQLEERKRKLRELGYDDKLITQALILEEQKYQQEIENTNKKLQARIYEIQGKKYDAFIMSLEEEIEAYKKQGADEVLIEQYKVEKIKQFWKELASEKRNFYIELARLRGNDREAFRLELERQKEDYRKLGIDEVEIKKWETLKWQQFEEEKLEKIQRFYTELYKLRGEDTEIFKMELEQQKKEYEKLGIESAKIKEWETLKWKQFEEEKTAKLKEEAEARASAERTFWINFNRLLGKERLAEELALEEEKERLKKQGYIDEELINLYIEEEKKQKILNIQKELTDEIKKIILSETEYKIYEFGQSIEKYKEYEELRAYLSMLSSLKIKEIYKDETETIMNEIKERIDLYQKEKEEALSNIERQSESRKKYLTEIYSLNQYLTDLDQKLIDLAEERERIIQETGDEELANVLIQTKISQYIEETNKKYKDALEKRLELNKEIQNEILKLEGNTLQAEINNLIERINKYAESGADLVNLEQLYNLEILNIKKKATDEWIAEEKRKFLSVRELEESIRKFQEEGAGKKPTKVESAIQQKVDESLNLINKVFNTVSSGEITLEEAFNIIQNDIIPYVNVSQILGKYHPLLKKANEEAKQKVVEYANKLYGIYSSQLDYQIPEFKNIKLKEPEELPQFITPEMIKERWDAILKALEDINVNVKNWVEEKTKEINQKFIDSIYNDEQIKNAINKLLQLPYEILTQINWNDLGVNVGNDIAEGLITGAVNTLKEKFPGIDWDSLINSITKGGEAGQNIGAKGGKADLPKDIQIPEEIKDIYKYKGEIIDIETLKNLSNKIENFLDNIKNVYTEQSVLIEDFKNKIIEKFQNITNLDEKFYYENDQKQFKIIELLEENQKQYTLADYLKERIKNTVTQTLFSGDISYEKAGYKDLLEKYWATPNVYATEEWDRYLLDKLYAPTEILPQKEEKGQIKIEDRLFETLYSIFTQIEYLYYSLTKPEGTGEYIIPGAKAEERIIQPQPVIVNVYIDGKKVDGVVSEIVKENLSGKII